MTYDYRGSTLHEVEIEINGELYCGYLELNPSVPLVEENLPPFQGFGRYGKKLVAGWHFDRHPGMKPTYAHEIRGRSDPKSNPRHHSTRERLMHRRARRDISKFLAE